MCTLAWLLAVLHTLHTHDGRLRASGGSDNKSLEEIPDTLSNKERH